MFEEFIAQGNDMIRRQQPQVGLSLDELRRIPESELVSLIEATAWQRGIEERIRNSFGEDAYARYRIFWDVFKDDIAKGRGDESSRSVNLWRRIIAYLVELDARLAAKDKTIGISESNETRRAG